MERTENCIVILFSYDHQHKTVKDPHFYIFTKNCDTSHQSTVSESTGQNSTQNDDI